MPDLFGNMKKAAEAVFFLRFAWKTVSFMICLSNMIKFRGVTKNNAPISQWEHSIGKDMTCRNEIKHIISPTGSMTPCADPHAEFGGRAPEMTADSFGKPDMEFPPECGRTTVVTTEISLRMRILQAHPTMICHACRRAVLLERIRPTYARYVGYVVPAAALNFRR